MTKRYKLHRRCFDGNGMKEPGEFVERPDDFEPPPWMEEVEYPAPPPAPQPLSALAKEPPAGHVVLDSAGNEVKLPLVSVSHNAPPVDEPSAGPQASPEPAHPDKPPAEKALPPDHPGATLFDPSPAHPDPGPLDLVHHPLESPSGAPSLGPASSPPVSLTTPVPSPAPVNVTSAPPPLPRDPEHPA